MEMWMWKRIEKKTGTRKICIPNEALQRVDEKRQLVNLITDYQSRWISHVMHGDTVLKEVIEGRMEGKQQIGRPRCKTLNWMINRYGYSYQNLKLNI